MFCPLQASSLPTTHSFTAGDTPTLPLEEIPVDPANSTVEQDASELLESLPLPVEDRSNDDVIPQETIPSDQDRTFSVQDFVFKGDLNAFDELELTQVALDEIKSILRENLSSTQLANSSTFPELSEQCAPLDQLNLLTLHTLQQLIDTQPTSLARPSAEIDCSSRDELVGETYQLPVRVNLSFENLIRIRTAITQHYLNAGYVTSFAYIPEQTFRDVEGTVEIQIVEGQLQHAVINIRNLDVFDDQARRDRASNYVSALFKAYLEEADVDVPLNQSRLVYALSLLQDDPRISNVDANLAQTDNPAYSQLTVDVDIASVEHDFWERSQAQLGVNNYRSPSIGSVERRLQITIPNLFYPVELMQRDTLSLQYANTEGSHDIDLAYFLPFDEVGTAELRTGWTRSELQDEPFNRLDAITEIQYFEVAIRHPLGSSTSSILGEGWFWEVTGSLQGSDSEIAGFQLPFSEDADRNGRTRLAVVRSSADVLDRSTQHVLYGRAELSFGDNTSVGDAPFLITRLDGQWVRRLGDARLLVRGRAQLALSQLPALEQFGIGGQQTVRGYRQNLLLTDNALLGSVELQLPLFSPDLTVAPFIDFGTGWNTSSNETLDLTTLWSTGIAVQLQLGELLRARLDWGIPLVSVDSLGNSLQEEGIYFSIVATP